METIETKSNKRTVKYRVELTDDGPSMAIDGLSLLVSVHHTIMLHSIRKLAKF